MKTLKLLIVMGVCFGSLNLYAQIAAKMDVLYPVDGREASKTTKFSEESTNSSMLETSLQLASDTVNVDLTVFTDQGFLYNDYYLSGTINFNQISSSIEQTYIENGTEIEMPNGLVMYVEILDNFKGTAKITRDRRELDRTIPAGYHKDGKKISIKIIDSIERIVLTGSKKINGS
ncbi:hypothetical protein MRY82_10400 [bacterium]|nr:hypothetical protein [bacterium]